MPKAVVRSRFPREKRTRQNSSIHVGLFAFEDSITPIEELSDETRDMHRAIVSLMEELEAVDWYNQRADACKDVELKAILAHNRDEEKEHAPMTAGGEAARRRSGARSVCRSMTALVSSNQMYSSNWRGSTAWK